MNYKIFILYKIHCQNMQKIKKKAEKIDDKMGERKKDKRTNRQKL